MPLFDPRNASADWAREKALFEHRRADPELLTQALKIMREEQVTKPSFHRTPLPLLLAQMEETREAFRTSSARRAGSVKKTDALQTLIQAIVRGHPKVTQSELLAELRQRQALRNVVVDIDEDCISFADRDRLKTAKIRGLKDRLSRAKRHSRYPVRATTAPYPSW